MPPDDFSLNGYAAIVAAFQKNGFACVGFDDVPEADKARLILRHDVDVSMRHAAALAQREAEIGVSSTYFVLMGCAFYNLFSGDDRVCLQAIAGHGHRIGLHFDTTPYDRDDWDRAATQECDALANLTGQSVDVISFHRPMKELVGNADRIGGRKHTYMPEFVERIGYVSDSRGRWGHGHPLDHPGFANRSDMQLLTHPVWWAEDAPTVQEKLEKTLDQHYGYLENRMASEITVYKSRRPGSGENT